MQYLIKNELRTLYYKTNYMGFEYDTAWILKYFDIQKRSKLTMSK